MIPITRKELYLNKIVGNNDYETPEKPITEEEFFFAEILGEAVQAPEPLTRYQIYLAKIAGHNIEIPTPITRLEHFLARAAGMDVETPVPITREEIYWSNYTAIVEFEFEGVPPLTYKAIEGTLKNYRIYGNTVNGESVGDRTANLFANLWKKGYIRADNGREEQIDGFICSGFFPVEYGQTYSISRNINVGYDNIRGYRDDESFIGAGTDICDVSNPFPSAATNIGAFTVTNENVAFVRFNDSANDLGMKYMIVKGTYTEQTMPDYEPYGYRVPVTVSNGTDTLTTPIYLPEQIKKVGDEAEYIDYAEEQKQPVDADEEIEKQAATYMVSITPKTDVSKIEFVTMSSVPGDCTILISGLIFTLDEADANTLNSTNYADGVRGKASTAHNYRFTWTKKYTEGETYYIRSYVKYQTADNEIKEVYGDVYKADINGFERVRKNQLDVTLPALPTLPGTNVLSVGTAVQPSGVYIKGEKRRE